MAPSQALIRVRASLKERSTPRLSAVNLQAFIDRSAEGALVMAAKGKAVLASALVAVLLALTAGWWTFVRGPAPHEQKVALQPGGSTTTDRVGQKISDDRSVRRPSPPKLAAVRVGLVPQPSDPEYRSFDLLKAASRVPPAAIFENEPRVDGWALAMEEQLRSQLVADLGTMVPRALVVEVACKMSACRVLLEMPSDEEPGALMGALQIAPLGKALSIEGLNAVDSDGKWRATYYSFHDQPREPRRSATSVPRGPQGMDDPNEARRGQS